MKVSSMFAGKYMKAADLDEAEISLTIDDVRVENVGNNNDPQDEKPVVYFHEGQKLALNKTNAATIVKAFGDETDGWVGKRLIIFGSETEYAGNVVGCLRVRVPKDSSPAQHKTVAAGDIPF